MTAAADGAVVLDLRYRSAGAFLVAYSAQLAKGELFVETPSPWPPGSGATLRLHVPGAPPLETGATVSDVRAEALGPGQPAGMTLALAASLDAYGAVIDELAARYDRIRILLGTGEPAPRAIISRYLRSILSCDLAEVNFQPEGIGAGGRPAGANGAPAGLSGAAPEPPSPAESAAGSNAAMTASALDGPIDLVVVDLDSSGPAGDALVVRLRQEPATSLVPIIVLAQLERDRARGVDLGADEALTNPPLYAELQSAVIHGLSRPQILGG